MIKILNKFSETIEDFKQDINEPIKIFICGPTLYDKIHVGHLKILFFSDLVVRYFKWKGYKVQPILNLTDMDFKIIERAKEENIQTQDLINYYYNVFKEDIKKLNLNEDFILVRPSELINKSVKIIWDLVEKKRAYFLEDGIFCDVSFSKNLGKLSKIQKEKLNELILEPNEKKRNPNDFRIWIKVNEKNYELETVFGRGFVGWHMQDFSVVEHFFNGLYDIHIGASDLIYPHHEFILLLGEYYKEKYPIVRYFLHTGVIKKNGEKMSKSLGNCIYMDELYPKFDSDDLRIYIFKYGYKDDVEFELADLYDSKGIKEKIMNVKFNVSNKETVNLNKKIDDYVYEFIENIENEFSVNKSLEVWVKLSDFLTNNELDKEGINKAKQAYKIFSEITGILLNLFNKK